MDVRNLVTCIRAPTQTIAPPSKAARIWLFWTAVFVVLLFLLRNGAWINLIAVSYLGDTSVGHIFQTVGRGPLCVCSYRRLCVSLCRTFAV